MFFLLAEDWNIYFFPPASSYSYWKPVDERKIFSVTFSITAFTKKVIFKAGCLGVVDPGKQEIKVTKIQQKSGFETQWWPNHEGLSAWQTIYVINFINFQESCYYQQVNNYIKQTCLWRLIKDLLQDENGKVNKDFSKQNQTEMIF